MKITYSDLCDFFIAAEPGSERTRNGKLLDPKQRAILAHITSDSTILERFEVAHEWSTKIVEARHEVYRDMQPVLDKYGIDPSAALAEEVARFSDEDRELINSKLRHFFSLTATLNAIDNTNVAVTLDPAA